MQRIKFAGLDVHADTIAVAVAEQGGEIRSLGTIPNREESVRKLVKKLWTIEQLRFCYEAGPTGYVLYWQLAKMGAQCEVLAPTLVPLKAGHGPIDTDPMWGHLAQAARRPQRRSERDRLEGPAPLACAVCEVDDQG
jgi:hypothetical protein